MSHSKPLSQCSVSKDDVTMDREDTSLEHVIKIEELDLEPDYIECDTDELEITDEDEHTVPSFDNTMDIKNSKLDVNFLTRLGKRRIKIPELADVIPFKMHDLINLPIDEFNERLSGHDLSEAQLSLVRVIRRRGKNKVAAQNCRQRKLDAIMSLANEVKYVRHRKQSTQREQHNLLLERQRLKERFAKLYRHIFQMSEAEPFDICSVSKDDVTMDHAGTCLDHSIKTEELDLKPDYLICSTDEEREMTDVDEQTEDCDSLVDTPNDISRLASLDDLTNIETTNEILSTQDNDDSEMYQDTEISNEVEPEVSRCDVLELLSLQKIPSDLKTEIEIEEMDESDTDNFVAEDKISHRGFKCRNRTKICCFKNE